VREISKNRRSHANTQRTTIYTRRHCPILTVFTDGMIRDMRVLGYLSPVDKTLYSSKRLFYFYDQQLTRVFHFTTNI